jgi:hypothetical protein
LTVDEQRTHARAAALHETTHLTGRLSHAPVCAFDSVVPGGWLAGTCSSSGRHHISTSAAWACWVRGTPVDDGPADQRRTPSALALATTGAISLAGTWLYVLRGCGCAGAAGRVGIGMQQPALEPIFQSELAQRLRGGGGGDRSASHHSSL